MAASRLDKAYRKLVLSKFFTKGWGKPENLKKLFEFRKLVCNRSLCYELVSPNHPVVITKEVDSKDTLLLEGHFLSPFHHYLPDLLPKEARKAHFQVLLPKKWENSHYKPVCLHLAGTGDHFFFRRRNLMAKPLLKEAGIGAILLENPFYGLRKPKDQVWSCLHNVSDIFVMGGCLILESLVLFHWCRRNGLGPFGVTGISMGGHMASLAATAWPEPLVLVPCLSWSTASIVFTRGVMSGAVNWDLLETQYYDNEIFSKEIQRMVRVVDDFLGGSDDLDPSYEAGQHFSQNFPASLKWLEINNNSSVGSTCVSNANHVASSEFSEIKAKDNQTSAVNISSSNKLTDLKENGVSLPMNKLNVDSNARDSEVKTSVNSEQIPISANSVRHSSAQLNDEILQTDTPSKMNSKRDILLEVLQESNLTDYAKFLDQNERKELEVTPISIRNYLSFVNRPEAPPVKNDEGDLDRKERKEKQRQQTSRFMCGIMDECTHLSNFSVPVDPELIISITAKDDAYVPRDGITDIRDIWKGAEVRYLNAGHVGAYLLHQNVFRTAIKDGFDKLRKKYHSESSHPEHRTSPCAPKTIHPTPLISTPGMFAQVLFALICILAWGNGARLTTKDIEEMDSYLKVYSCNNQQNKHLHVFTHKIPHRDTQRRRIRWHHVKPSDRSKSTDSDDIANRMLFLGGQKVDTNVKFRISNFSYDLCPGSENDQVKIKFFKLLEDPIVPGDVKVAFDNELLTDFEAPVKAEVEAYKEIFGAWIRMPCYNDLGSCTWEDACHASHYKPPCPADFQRDGIPCTCPFKKGTYKSDGLTVYAGITDPLDIPSWLTDGRYKGEITYYSKGKRLGCLRSQATITKVV